MPASFPSSRIEVNKKPLGGDQEIQADERQFANHS